MGRAVIGAIFGDIKGLPEDTRYIQVIPGGMGTKLAASVLITSENVCPRFLPQELGLDIDSKESLNLN